MAGEAYFHSGTNDLHGLAALVGGFILVFGCVSLIVKERLYLSESLVATLIGIVIGPVCIGLLNPDLWPGDINTITLGFTEIVISIQVMAAAVALPRQFWKNQYASLSILYGPVMIWMWLVSALAIWLILRFDWSQCLVLAACLAPTDPILANSIVTGRFADKYISVPIRNLLSGESAANDGLAIPFFKLGILLLKYPRGQAWGMWFYRVWLYEVGVAVVFGIVVGYTAKIALRASEKRNYIDKRSFLSFEIALATFTLGISAMLDLASFLAVFVTGLVFAWDGWFTEETMEAHVQEVVDNLINLTFFIYFGSIIPWRSFTHSLSIGSLFLLMAALLLLRRLPPVMFFTHIVPRPSLLTRREALLVGHFGPIGVGALWYMSYAYKHQVIGEDGVAVVFWVVLASVVCYGVMAVLMHGLVRTLSVVRVYSGRSATGRTLSAQVEGRVAMWPSGVPISVTAISGPIVSQRDMVQMEGRGREEVANGSVYNSNDTIHGEGLPNGILVKTEVGVEVDREGRERSEVAIRMNALGADEAGRDVVQHETIHIPTPTPVPLPISSAQPPAEQAPLAEERQGVGELGIPPGIVGTASRGMEGSEDEGGEGDVLVGVGVRFRRFDTR